MLYSDSPSSAFPSGTLPTANGELLVNWEPTNVWVNAQGVDTIIEIEGGSGFFELPSDTAFSRVLTEADDNNLLTFGLYANNTNLVIREVAAYLTIPASEWRTAPTIPATAGWASLNKRMWFLPVIFQRGDGWRRGLIGKGPNGRPGGIWAGAGYITGLKVWLNSAGGTSGPPAVSTHQRYGAYGEDASFFTTDFTGASGVSSTTNRLPLTGATGFEYVAFWSAQQLTRIDATGRAAFGSTNQIDNFTASRLTIISTNGYLYVSESAFAAGLINGAWTLE